MSRSFRLLVATSFRLCLLLVLHDWLPGGNLEVVDLVLDPLVEDLCC